MIHESSDGKDYSNLNEKTRRVAVSVDDAIEAMDAHDPEEAARHFKNVMSHIPSLNGLEKQRLDEHTNNRIRELYEYLRTRRNDIADIPMDDFA